MTAFLVLAILAMLGLAAITAVVDAARHPSSAYRAAGRSKAVTMAGLLLTAGVGAPFYWLYLRRRIRREEHRRPRQTRQRPNYDLWAEDAIPPWS